MSDKMSCRSYRIVFSAWLTACAIISGCSVMPEMPPAGMPTPSADSCEGITCPDGQSCVDGACVASASQDPCDGVTCVDGQSCIDGQCVTAGSTGPGDPCLVDLLPEDQVNYQEALNATPVRVGDTCSVAGTCDAGDELGVLMFIRTGEGNSIETRYFSGETEKFVGLTRLGEDDAPRCAGMEYGPMQVDCQDEEIAVDLCELQTLRDQQLDENQALQEELDSGLPGTEQMCGTTPYDSAQFCCNHVTGELSETRLGQAYDLMDGCRSTRVSVDEPVYTYADGCSIGSQVFTCGGASVRWGCPDDEPGCEAAKAATESGDLDALTSLPCNWHDLCYTVCGKSVADCDGKLGELLSQACDDFPPGPCRVACKAKANVIYYALVATEYIDENFDDLAEQHHPHHYGQNRYCQCCTDVYFEDTGMLDRDEEQDCVKIVASGRVLEPRGPAFEALEFDDLPVAVRFEWFPSDEDPCLADSEVVTIHSMEEIGAIYPELTDAYRWDQSRYYSTIRVEEVDGDIYLIARGSGGVVSHRLDMSTGVWNQVAPTYPIMNTAGWDARQYNSTIRTEVVGTDLYLLARGAGGVISHKLDTVTGEWSQVAETYGIMNTPGWDDVQYNSTIRTAVVDHELFLLARAARGIVTHRLNSDDGEWAQVRGSCP